MRKIIVVYTVVLLTNVSFAGIFFHTGLELLPRAQQWNNYFARRDLETKWQAASYFQGFVSGVASTARDRLNLPEGAQVDQLCKIVYQYLEDNSNQLHKPAADLVIEALHKAWPSK